MSVRLIALTAALVLCSEARAQPEPPPATEAQAAPPDAARTAPITATTPATPESAPAQTTPAAEPSDVAAEPVPTPASTHAEAAAPAPSPPMPQSATELFGGTAADVQDIAFVTGAGPFGGVDVYGFADFTFAVPVLGANNAWKFYVPDKPMFWVGHINVYFASQITEMLRSLIEIRFTYLPHGKNRSGIELPGQPYVNNSAADYADVERTVKLGSILIERAQLGYAPTDWLTITVGQWLTPYGIWNVEHGTPTTIMANRPYVVGEQLIPERLTGVLLESSFRLRRQRVGAALGVSNGRGPLDAYFDMDQNKALNARAFWHPSGLFGDLTLGASAYLGRYTDAQRSSTVVTAANGKPRLEAREQVNVQYDEYAVGLDGQWTRGGFRVFGEMIWNIRKYTQDGRPRATGLIDINPSDVVRLAPDSRRYGGYLIGGYRFAWLGIMPCVQLEAVHLDDPFLPWVINVVGAINARPHPAVTVKLQFGSNWFVDANPQGPGRDSIRGFASQVAWAF